MDNLSEFLSRAASVLEVDPDSLSAGTRFRELDGWCSLKAFGLLMALENDFGARLDIGVLMGVDTLGELAALVPGPEGAE